MIVSDKKKNVYAGFLLLLFAIFIYVVSFWIPESKSDILGSRFFPRCTAVLMGSLSGILILTNVNFNKSEEIQPGETIRSGFQPSAFAHLSGFNFILSGDPAAWFCNYLHCLSFLPVPYFASKGSVQKP